MSISVKQYENQLKDLKTNSKPMINSLTMMAEDCIRQAELIVEVTEEQLRKVDPEFKLPILYLIDSIVKRVKQDYVTYFSNNIVNTFTETFEQVPDETRRELRKLRQTWNKVFAYDKLYLIDIRCHQIDPSWPVIAPPNASSKIHVTWIDVDHVNPKFLQKALTSTSPTTSSSSTTAGTIGPTSTAGTPISLGLPGLNDITATLAASVMDPSSKALLLMKRKELLEFEAKKIELELLASQKQNDLSKVQQPVVVRAAEQAELEAEADTESRQQHLLHQSELAKLQKDQAGTLLSNAPTQPTAAPAPSQQQTPPPKESSRNILSPLPELTSLGGDVDLRIRILHDVHLKNEAGAALEVEDNKTESRPLKKARNWTIMDDLFGREDVDYRQQGGGACSVPANTLTTTTWAQAKKPPTRNDSQDDDDETKLFENIVNRSHAPPLISPTTSIGSSWDGGCDLLGRPLLYNRLPGDPAERNPSLDSRVSIDPVERFRNQFIEKPSMSTGNVSIQELQQAVMNAQNQLALGLLTREHFATFWRQLMQINQVNKIRDLEVQTKVEGDRPGPNPWTDAWGQFGAGDFSDGRFGNATAPAPSVPNPWGTPSVTWGQEQPRGPNPFVEAAAAMAMNPPLPTLKDIDVIPPVDPVELNKVRNDSAGTICIDKVRHQFRFYGETAVVLQSSHGDEPREISYHRGTPKNVFIDKEREPMRCYIGKPAMIYLDRQKHMLKLGAPTRELYIDGNHYEAYFGGPPVRVQLGRYFHSFKLEGPPPQVELGKVPRFDLLAGRVNLFVDGNAVGVYLDDKPQLLDLGGFPVIIRFIDNFHKVLLNNRPFPVEFGGPAMRLAITSGRKHFLRFTALSAKTRMAMDEFNKARESDDGSNCYRS